eukprot:6182935-Pyramimonas_sp.AAC.1
MSRAPLGRPGAGGARRAADARQTGNQVCCWRGNRKPEIISSLSAALPRRHHWHRGAANVRVSHRSATAMVD